MLLVVQDSITLHRAELDGAWTCRIFYDTVYLYTACAL
jgi:hypothetical protein